MISVIEPVGGHGGMNYYDLGLCSGAQQAGAKVTLYTCDKNPPQPAPGSFKVLPVFRRIYGSDPAWRRGLRYVWGLLRALVGGRLKGATVVHFHFFHVGGLEFLSVVLSRLLAYKVVVTAHDVEAFKEGLSIQWLVGSTYAMVHEVIAHNRSSGREVSEKLKVKPERVHTIPHGNYLEFVGRVPSREEARRSLGWLPSETGPVVLFFGQIKEVKGLDLLIQAFAAVRQHHPSATLVIAGRVWKDDFSRYASLIEQLALTASVRLHIRYIRDDEVAHFYAAADVVVLPYRRIYQSGVLLMAMSYGVPVIASDLDAMKDVVCDGVNGFLFKNGDAPDLARVINQALSDSNARSQVAAQALHTMKTDFDWLKIGQQLVEVYNKP
ncbi:MAG: glycosyltransferase family 4 protein [Burkholderiales bacterium]